MIPIGFIHFREAPALAQLRFHTIIKPPANEPSEIAVKNRCANPIDVLIGIIRMQRDATHDNPVHS